MIYKLVLGTFSEDLQPKKIKFVPITKIILQKINLEHLKLLKPLGLRFAAPSRNIKIGVNS